MAEELKPLTGRELLEIREQEMHFILPNRMSPVYIKSIGKMCYVMSEIMDTDYRNKRRKK